MAKNYKYNKTVMEKFNIKGNLSQDGKEIEYENSDKVQEIISVEKIFSKFAGEDIVLSISLKTDADLSDEFED